MQRTAGLACSAQFSSREDAEGACARQDGGVQSHEHSHHTHPASESQRSAADEVERRYQRFAEREAPGRSALYGEWAAGVASDPLVQGVLARIAATHRQPPLVFAVARLLGAPLEPWPVMREWMLLHADALVAACAERSLQTNEPLRCAVLLPALALIEGPIALLEVGASAGLCLFPDHYSYRYRDASGAVVSIDPEEVDAASGGASGASVAATAPVVLDCELRGPVPPLRVPEIVWRAGIDLQPLDASDDGDRAWLTGLVWPGEEGRAERVTRALDIVAREAPAGVPLVRQGDAVEMLAALAAEAPAGATLVITTPGVLAHVPWAGRMRIIETAQALPGHWITLDDPGLHQAWHPPIDAADWPEGGFALALDGEVLAAADPLGGWLAWRGSAGGGALTLEA